METTAAWMSSVSGRRLRKNHSGMETDIWGTVPQAVQLLRKNHSGMETFGTLWRIPCFFCCVRTIVVWKRTGRISLIFTSLELRKNHSGMETYMYLYLLYRNGWGCVRTIVVWKPKNYPHIHIITCSCVRTIVVWKLFLSLMESLWVYGLRKNHSGM